MNSILSKLYMGDLSPFEAYKPTIEAFEVKKETAFEGYSKFREALPSEMHQEFDELLDNHLELLPLELQENFIAGFRMGMRLLLEVLYEEKKE